MIKAQNPFPTSLHTTTKNSITLSPSSDVFAKPIFLSIQIPSNVFQKSTPLLRHPKSRGVLGNTPIQWLQLKPRPKRFCHPRSTGHERHIRRSEDKATPRGPQRGIHLRRKRKSVAGVPAKGDPAPRACHLRLNVKLRERTIWQMQSCLLLSWRSRSGRAGSMPRYGGSVDLRWSSV